jgi:hypothetical protein
VIKKLCQAVPSLEAGRETAPYNSHFSQSILIRIAKQQKPGQETVGIAAAILELSKENKIVPMKI